MLESYRRGFAVMDADLHGTYIEDEDFETCLRYCHDNCVIVERIPKKCGFSIRVERTLKFDKPLWYDKYSNRLDIGKIHIWFNTEYWHVNGKIVFVK